MTVSTMSSERGTFMMDGRNVSLVGYRPSDDYYLSQDLVNATLFLQVLLWNYLLYLLVYNILLIMCQCMMDQRSSHLSILTYQYMSVRNSRSEDSEDGFHYLRTTVFLFIMTSFSITGILMGQSLFTLVFILTVLPTCICSIDNELDSEFQQITRFFGDEMIDKLANVLLILVEAAASIVTLVYLYQVIATRYESFLTIYQPLIHF